MWANFSSIETFEWYCKHGGENSGIDVVIHLRNSSGNIEDNFPSFIEVKTELVYDDGSPTPITPLAPMKVRRSARSTLTLFRSMRPDITFGYGKGSQEFTFRIEEVSFRHQGHRGFKLKVSSRDSSCTNVLPGLMEETLIVKSKPKFIKDTRERGGRTTLVGNAKGIVSSISRNDEHKIKYIPRNVHLTSSQTTSKHYVGKSIATLPLDQVSTLFTAGGTACTSCNVELGGLSGLYPSHHTINCRLAMTLAPYILIDDPKELSYKLINSRAEFHDGDVYGGAPIGLRLHRNEWNKKRKTSYESQKIEK